MSFQLITKDDPPDPLLLESLKRMPPQPGIALDLGCGSGRDSLELARLGWQVTAIDKESQGLEFIKLRSLILPGQITTEQNQFETVSLPAEHFDFVYSAFALSFCHPVKWQPFWQQVLGSLKTGGYLAANFFGPADGFADSPRSGGMTFFGRNELSFLFADFEVQEFIEKKFPATSRMGQMKHWHIFSILGRKKQVLGPGLMSQWCSGSSIYNFAFI